MNSRSNDKVSRLKMRLTAIRYGARDVNMYDFSLLDGGELPTGEAGAHISLFLPNGLERQYSLVHAENSPTTYTIGVKLDAESRGGSLYMHEKLSVGTILDIEPPINHFVLETEAEHTVLVAGGIGVTPLYCMMEQLERLNKGWEMHYSCRSREDALFLSQFEGDDRVHLYFDDERNGAYLPLGDIVKSAPEGAHFYCCGPVPMLGAFEGSLVDHPTEKVHVEYFSAKDEAALAGGYKIELALSGVEIEVEPGVSILNTLLKHGIEVPFSCAEGACGACEVDVIEGEPDHRDVYLSEKEKAANESMMVCCSGSKGGRLVLDI
ncbi:MAG: oxidoreductase [Emcibacter sp.]|nr:oxidoreductase [Emcibacter sp.]